MSKWVECQLELQCSLDYLKRALINVMPDWEKYLLIDSEGNLSLHRYSGAGGEKMANKGFYLVIPGSGHPGAFYPPSRSADNDWGFYLKSGTPENGVWGMFGAEYGHAAAQKVAHRVTGEVAHLSTVKRNQELGFKPFTEKIVGDQMIIEALVPDEPIMVKPQFEKLKV